MDFDWSQSRELADAPLVASPVRKKRKRSITRDVPSLTLNCNVARPRPLPQPMYQTPSQQLHVQHHALYPQLYPSQYQYLQPQNERYLDRQRQPQRPGMQQQPHEVQQQRYDMAQYQSDRFTQWQDPPLPYQLQPEVATYLSPSPFKLSDSPFHAPEPLARSVQFHVTHKRQADSIVLTPVNAIDPNLLDSGAIKFSSSSSQLSMRSSVLQSAQAFFQDLPRQSPESLCVPFRKSLERFRETVEDLCHLVREPTSERWMSLLESIEVEKEMVDKEYIALKQSWIIPRQTWLKSRRNSTTSGSIDPTLSNHEITKSSSSLSLASSRLQSVQETFPSTEEHLSNTKNPCSSTLDLFWGMPDFCSDPGIGTFFSDPSILSSFGSLQPKSVQTDITSRHGQGDYN
jgi:hypothetical protein